MTIVYKSFVSLNKLLSNISHDSEIQLLRSNCTDLVTFVKI